MFDGLPEQEFIRSGRSHGITWGIRKPYSYCGYAQLPQDHPWRTTNTQRLPSDALDIHGGITYGMDDEGWIGFDFAHGCDIVGHQEDGTIIFKTTLDDVIQECKNLCQQIYAARK